MSKGPATAVYDRDAGQTRIAGSAVFLGTSRARRASPGRRGRGHPLRSPRRRDRHRFGGARELRRRRQHPACPTTIGRRTTFGHRCLVIGATVGDLCEIGNASILMPGARLGDRVFLGEGTLVPTGMTLPTTSSPSAGRLASSARSPTPTSTGCAACATATSPSPATRRSPSDPHRRPLAMGQLYAYRGILPTIADVGGRCSRHAEITGDVVIGERTIIGAGVKIIGDSHGPVRIGNDVQILENTVLHLLPDNELVIDDGAIVGPGAMIHGCHIGAGTVVEPGRHRLRRQRGRRRVRRARRRGRQAALTLCGAAPRSTASPPSRSVASQPRSRPPWALDADDLPSLRRADDDDPARCPSRRRDCSYRTAVARRAARRHPSSRR